MSEEQGERAAPEEQPKDKPKRGIPTGFATLRDVLSFVAGMVVIGHEVFFSSSVEPAAIAVGVTLTGLPLVFGADERKNRGRDGK